MPNKEIEMRPIQTEDDALKVNPIRNECASFMTHDTRLIDDQSQVNWYRNSYLEKTKTGEMTVYLLESTNPPQAIGFGVVRLMDGKYWLTGGLREAYRGKGYGQLLFGHLVDETPANEVWLDVLDTNDVGKHVYHKLCFEDTSYEKNEHDQDITIMKLEKVKKEKS